VDKRNIYLVLIHSSHSKLSRRTVELLVSCKVYMCVFLFSVVASYLWMVKYSFYRKLIEKTRRKRAREDNVPSVKQSAEHLGLTLSSENCGVAPRTLS